MKRRPAPNRLRSLNVVLTSACNLRCAYCYLNARHRGVMTWPTLEAAISRLLASSRTNVSLTFTGGEPLLEFRLLRRAIEYVKVHKRAGQALDVYLLTNGTLLGRRESRFLARAGVNVRISLDGASSAQTLRVRGTFRLLDALLDRLRREQPAWFRDRVSIGAVVTSANAACLGDSVAYLLSKGVRDIGISPVLTYQPGWRREDIHVLEEGMAHAFHVSLDHFRRSGEVPVRLFRRRAKEERIGEPPDALCGAGRADYVTVDVDGEVAGCALLVRSYHQFPDAPLGRAVATLQAGSICNPDLTAHLAACRRRIRDTGLFTGRSSKRSSYGRCAVCPHRKTCSVCPLTIVHQPGNADPNRIPDFACAFQRAAGRFGHRLPL